MVGWHDVEIFAISPASRPKHYIMAPPSWCAFECHCLLFLAAFHLSYYNYYIFSRHERMQLIWLMDMSKFSVCTFMAILCLPRDGLVSAEGGYGSRSIWNSGVLASLPSGVCETLQKMVITEVLHDSVFDMSFGCKAYCRSRDVDWPQCMLSCFLYNYGICEVSIVPQPSVSSNRHRILEGESVSNGILPASSLFFVPGTSIYYRLFRYGCVDGSLSTTHLSSQTRRSHWRFLMLAT